MIEEFFIQQNNQQKKKDELKNNTFLIAFVVKNSFLFHKFLKQRNKFQCFYNCINNQR